MQGRVAGMGPALVLILYGTAIGIVAALLNWNFYSSHGPFYDSMAYFNQLAWVMQYTRENGLWAALGNSHANSTVFLPWLAGALLSYLTEPSRMLGVVIQMPLVFLQLVTGYRFFRAVGASQWRAVLYSVPLVSFPAVFFFNGGLGDFRMDLSQALAYGSFLAALMVARKRDSLKEWAFVGLVISIACLVRATTPVYVSIVLGAAFLIDLRKTGPAPTLQRYLLASGVVILLTGWFYLLNFEHLHYYYFIWNTDANARLPLRESVAHVRFVANHLGNYLLAALLVLMLAASPMLAKDWRRYSSRINWIVLAGALVPIAYLVISGAGLNPFAAMAAVPGFILFALHVAELPDAPARPAARRIVPVILLIALPASIWTSIRQSERSIYNWIPDKQGVTQLVEAVRDDGRAQGISQIKLAFLHLGSVDGATITNHLIYEKGYVYAPNQGHKYTSNLGVSGDGIAVRTIRNGFHSEVEWSKIPGAADQEKLAHVVKDALEMAGYVVIADAESNLPPHHRINRYAAQLRGILGSSREAEKLKGGIALSATEKVSLYRVIRR